MPGNFHEVPYSVIKTWPPPNYIDPVRRSWLPALSCTLLAVSTVLISGRFYLRARGQAGQFGLDDLFIFIGWFVSVGFSTLAVIDSEWYGLDVHTWDVNPNQYVGAALTGWIAQIFFLISTSATKISVLLFYRRMVKDTYSRRWLYAIWTALGFTAGVFVSVLITYCLICRPLNAYWLSYDFTYDEEFTCINGDILSPMVGALSMIGDVYAVALPCIMLQYYNLDVPRRQKIGLNIIFGLGTIVAGCGIARTYYLWEINHTYDTSWTGFNLFVWSLLECHLAIIFACAPSLRAFVRKYLGESIRSTFRSRSGGRSKDRTNTTSQNVSTLQSSSAPDPEVGKIDAIVEHRVITTPSEETMVEQTEDWSMRSRVSDRIPHATIRSADDYEAYAMRQLSQHGYKKSYTSEKLREEMNDPRRKHEADNALSWLDDESS